MGETLPKERTWELNLEKWKWYIQEAGGRVFSARGEEQLGTEERMYRPFLQNRKTESGH